MKQKTPIASPSAPRSLLVRGFWIFVLALFVIPAGVVLPLRAETRPPEVTVILSRNKRPYVEAAEGAREVLAQSAGANVETESLDRLKGAQLDALHDRIAEEKNDLLIAVGPDATRFVWARFTAPALPKLYTIVLNPEAVIGPSRTSCGVSMNIPAGVQLEMMARGLPSARRIGLLFDPKYNNRFFDEASAVAASSGREILPLRVSSRREIPGVLATHWREMDALWMIPDRTVIFETLVKHVIREGVKRRIPTIGYNRFFYESGAALAFVFDYAELGRQCGRAALDVLAGRGCREQAPLFDVWVNAKVMKKLDWKLPEILRPPIKEGP